VSFKQVVGRVLARRRVFGQSSMHRNGAASLIPHWPAIRAAAAAT
jgi:hypothetical protein